MQSVSKILIISSLNFDELKTEERNHDNLPILVFTAAFDIAPIESIPTATVMLQIFLNMMRRQKKNKVLERNGKHSSSMSRDMRFPTMWYVRLAKPQISLRIRAV